MDDALYCELFAQMVKLVDGNSETGIPPMVPTLTSNVILSGNIGLISQVTTSPP